MLTYGSLVSIQAMINKYCHKIGHRGPLRSHYEETCLLVTIVNFFKWENIGLKWSISFDNLK